MIDFTITEKDVAASRARWEPEFRAFAKRTSAMLDSTRRLPVYEQAVHLAEDWLRSHILRVASAPSAKSPRVLLLVGDEHLSAACQNVLDPVDAIYIHIFPQAWAHWHTTEFRGDVWWWHISSWAINHPARLIEFASHSDSEHSESQHSESEHSESQHGDSGLADSANSEPGLRLIPNERYLLSISGRPRNTDSICYLVDDVLVVDEPYCEWVVS